MSGLFSAMTRGAVIAFPMRRKAAHPMAAADFAGLPLLEAMVRVGTLAGKKVDAAGLTAALPTNDGDLDARFAPIAFARVDIDAQWVKRSVRSLSAAQLPAIVRLTDGRHVIVADIAGTGALGIVDANGERTVLVDEFVAATQEMVLLVGHIDPANGSTSSDERERIRANPRLWLLASFLTERRHFTQLLGAAVFLNLCAFAIPLYMRAIYDRVVPNLAIETLWALSIGIVLVLVFECLFKQIRSTFVDAIGLRIGQAIQHRAMSSILQARIDKSNWTVGSMMTALRDIESMAMLAPQAIVTFCIDIPFFFVFLALIAMIGGWAVVAPLIGALAMVATGAVSAYALKFGARRSNKLQQARNNLVADVVASLHTIKSNQAEGRFLRRWDIISDHVGVNGKATRGWAELPAVASAFIVQGVTVGIVIISIYQIQAGVMTAGALIACNMLAGRAMGPISSAIAIVSKGYQSLTQFAALANLLSLEPEAEVSDAAVKGKPFAGRVAFQDVGYTYPDTNVGVLRGIDLELKPGEKLGIIGVAGSGKSTLLKLMGGLISPSAGRLLVDGHAIEQFAASDLRENIAMATQDAMLFEDTIYENIVLGNPSPDPALLEAAIRTAGVHTFVARSKEGLSRNVGVGGCRLSGGQRQAVVLARAFMRDPRILLLDEPTAAMDVDGEQAVIRGLRTFGAGRTMVIATHRFAVLELVDRILWMEDGRILSDKPSGEMLASLRQRGARAAA
jgi:ATP-binding cassette, subfamily C, bacterial LapB